MSIIRFTVIDRDGITSFVGPCHAIKMLVAACSRFPGTVTELLEITHRYDPAFVASVRRGLSIFDEHNTPEEPAAFTARHAETPSHCLPPFRVLDETTRRASLAPAGSGLIMFNLADRRIIQVQNSYAEVLRADRGRIRLDGKPTRMLYHYRLPEEWRIVP